MHGDDAIAALQRLEDVLVFALVFTIVSLPHYRLARDDARVGFDSRDDVELICDDAVAMGHRRLQSVVDDSIRIIRNTVPDKATAFRHDATIVDAVVSYSQFKIIPGVAIVETNCRNKDRVACAFGIGDVGLHFPYVGIASRTSVRIGGILVKAQIQFHDAVAMVSIGQCIPCILHLVGMIESPSVPFKFLMARSDRFHHVVAMGNLDGLVNNMEARFKHLVFNHLTLRNHFSRWQLIEITGGFGFEILILGRQHRNLHRTHNIGATSGLSNEA